MNSITDLLHSENEYYDNQKVPGFVQGIVVENNNADFKGMVKVEFTVWETGKNMCEWVRLLSPYAGKDYGTYLVPEIDEMVLVGFIGGSLKRPFLLGSLYPSGASVVSENFDQKNLKKHLKTKGGMDLLIQEEDGKQSITLTTPKGSVIAVDDSTENGTGASDSVMFSRRAVNNALMNKLERHYGKTGKSVKDQAGIAAPKLNSVDTGRSADDLRERLNFIKKYI